MEEKFDITKKVEGEKDDRNDINVDILISETKNLLTLIKSADQDTAPLIKSKIYKNMTALEMIIGRLNFLQDPDVTEPVDVYIETYAQELNKFKKELSETDNKD
jgi:23S rRNA maturation mini-RNase III